MRRPSVASLALSILLLLAGRAGGGGKTKDVETDAEFPKFERDLFPLADAGGQDGHPETNPASGDVAGAVTRFSAATQGPRAGSSCGPSH